MVPPLTGIRNPSEKNLHLFNMFVLEMNFNLGISKIFLRISSSLRIQVCPESGISPISPFMGMGCFDHQSYSRKGSGFIDHEAL